MRTVIVVCAGKRKHPHPDKLAFVARFQPIEKPEGEEWDELDVETRQYRAEMDKALDESPLWMPPSPETPGPRQVATQWLTEDGVPMPDNIEGAAEGLAFWDKRVAYRKFTLVCHLCRLDVRLRDRDMFARLTEANPSGYGESRVLLHTLC